VHEVAAVQDSQNSWPVGTAGFGLGVMDHPAAPEALAGLARPPTRSTAATSKIDLFMAIPSPNPPRPWTPAPEPLHRDLTKSSHPLGKLTSEKLARADMGPTRLPDLLFRAYSRAKPSWRVMGGGRCGD
jgi:hypothetical protein